MSTLTLLPRLTGSRPVRSLTQAFFREYSRRRVRKLDCLDSAQHQERTLLSLVRSAVDTRFGREHEFGRIRSVADYQARVPLRDYETFWRQYWQPAFPHLRGVTWPGAIPYFALSSGTTSGTTKYIPVSREMLASNRRAALTTMGLFQAARPACPIWKGRIFFLGGSTDLTRLGPGVRAGDLSGIAACEVSSALRPYTFPPLDLALSSDWEAKVNRLAEASARLPITVLSGVPSWMLVLFDRLKQVTGRRSIADIWPSLRLVIHGGTKFDPYARLFREQIGNDAVEFLETYPCSEGFVATEDPRHGLLRLIPDHGIYFEFVPVAELDQDNPRRHGLAAVEPGVQYAVVLTTCAGLWSYVLGDTVCFERRDPPLLRFTGRTKYFLSAFGEHLISEEVERAVAYAADSTASTVVDFHVGPVFPEGEGRPGRHRYLIEFGDRPQELSHFAAELDEHLGSLNEDYRAHRIGDLTMTPPEVCLVPPGGFARWLRARGQLGGQHKVPRMDNGGRLTSELTDWFKSSG